MSNDKRKQHWLISLPSILIATSLIMSTFLPEHTAAQGPLTPTPNPTLEAMQQSIQAMSTRTAYLEMMVSLNKQATELQATKDYLPIVIFASLAAAISIILGIASPFVLIKRARASIEKRLDEAIYQADPTYLPIHVPAHDFKVPARRLERLGFRHLCPYSALTRLQFSGIVVYSANERADIEWLADLIQREKLDPERVAFIIYTPGRIPGGDLIYDVFDNVTFANNPITLATHIYALGRGLMHH